MQGPVQPTGFCRIQVVPNSQMFSTGLRHRDNECLAQSAPLHEPGKHVARSATIPCCLSEAPAPRTPAAWCVLVGRMNQRPATHTPPNHRSLLNVRHRIITPSRLRWKGYSPEPGRDHQSLRNRRSIEAASPRSSTVGRGATSALPWNLDPGAKRSADQARQGVSGMPVQALRHGRIAESSGDRLAHKASNWELLAGGGGLEPPTSGSKVRSPS